MWELLGSNSLLGTSRVGWEPGLAWTPAPVSGFRGTCFFPVGTCFTGQLTSWTGWRKNRRWHRLKDRNSGPMFAPAVRRYHTHTFRFLWHTLTSSTSRDTEFCSFSLSWDGFPMTKNTDDRLPESVEPAGMKTKNGCWEAEHWPALWKKPVKVSCRLEAKLWTRERKTVHTSYLQWQRRDMNLTI